MTGAIILGIGAAVAVFGYVMVVVRRSLKDADQAILSAQRAVEGARLAAQGLAPGLSVMSKQIPALRSLAEIRAAEPGAQVMVRGRLTATNKPLAESYAVYQIEQFRGLDYSDDEIWHPVKTAVQPLELELSDGLIRVMNGDYQLHFRTATRGSWSVHTERSQVGDHQVARVTMELNGRAETAAWDSAKQTGDVRYCGAGCTEDVLVTGTVATKDGSPVLNAQSVTVRQEQVSLFGFKAMAW